MTAAYALSPSASVDVLEKQPVLGGCLSSYHMDTYTIERYYHHCFPSDESLFHLLDTLGLADQLEWWKGTTGYYVDGTIYPLNTPAEILRYPALSILDKARLALLTLGAKKKDMAKLDQITAEQYIVEHYGRNLYHSFFEPLLISKFGEMRSMVSAAWLMSRIAIRSHRGLSGERLGYLKGGFQVLIDTLEQAIQCNGGTVERETLVTELRRKQDRWQVNGKTYDQVLLTLPPQEIERIADLPMPQVPYQGAACMTLGLDREVTEGVYWLNMRDTAPYGAVVAHTSFLPRERYQESILYLASYFSDHPPSHLEDRMLNDFCRRFGVQESEIRWHRTAVDRFAGPVYGAGYREMIPDYESHGLFLAGMFSRPNYPERSMEGSIRAALEAADRIQRRITLG